MKKKNLIITSSALAALAITGGAFAFFTSTQTATNTFTVGDVEVELEEPKWDELPDADDDGTPDIAENMTPGQVVPKNPTITNVGTIDAYGFVKVVIPYENVSAIDENGNQVAAADNELFQLLDTANAVGINAGWVEITGEVDGITYPYKDTANKTVSHIYAYASATAMTAIEAGEAVSPFDAVKFSAVTEGAFEGQDLDVVVTTYAVQTTNLGVTAPADVWEVVNDQVVAIPNN